MDRTQIDAEQVVARYLAGRLPATESDAFERYVSEHPEICNELEQTLKFREGLARLRERGELDALLQEPRPRRWLPMLPLRRWRLWLWAAYSGCNSVAPLLRSCSCRRAISPRITPEPK